MHGSHVYTTAGDETNGAVVLAGSTGVCEYEVCVVKNDCILTLIFYTMIDSISSGRILCVHNVYMYMHVHVYVSLTCITKVTFKVHPHSTHVLYLYCTSHTRNQCTLTKPA